MVNLRMWDRYIFDEAGCRAASTAEVAAPSPGPAFGNGAGRPTRESVAQAGFRTARSAPQSPASTGRSGPQLRLGKGMPGGHVARARFSRRIRTVTVLSP